MQYPVCECGNNPAISPTDFYIVWSEYGMRDKTLIQEADAKCKTCGEKFKFKKDYREE
jgi:hypothetical protein